MTLRFDGTRAAPDIFKAMAAVEARIRESGLERSILELVKMRASQINGCAHCLHMHATDARKAGESEMRLYLLDAWREATIYDERERAALGWTETLTRVAERGAPEAAWAEVKAVFDEAEIAALTFAIGAINLWNRLAIGAGASHPPIRRAA